MEQSAGWENPCDSVTVTQICVCSLFLPCSLFCQGYEQLPKNPVVWSCCVKGWPFCVQKEQRLQHREAFGLSSAEELCWHCCSPIKCHQIKPWPRVRCKSRCFRQECQLPFVFWNEHCEQSQSCSLTRETWVDFLRFWKAVSMYKDLKKKIFIISYALLVFCKTSLFLSCALLHTSQFKTESMFCLYICVHVHQILKKIITYFWGK